MQKRLKLVPFSADPYSQILTIKKTLPYGKQDKQILIASNDKKHPYYELKMMGALLKPVVLESVSSTIKGITAKIVGGVGDPVSTDNRDPGSRLQQRNWTIELESSSPIAARFVCKPPGGLGRVPACFQKKGFRV